MRLLALAPFLSLALSASITHEFEERAGSCKSPAIRVEWRRMKSADKAAYVAAEKCLMGKPSATDLRDSTSRFEDLQVVHQNLTNYVHGNSVFLPWHRYFLHMHETLLRTECSYKGPMPWWDETLDHGKFEQSGLFTKDYFGTTKVLGPDSTPECVTDGAFANTHLHIGPGAPDQNQPHCLSRGINNVLSKDVDAFFVNYCNDFSDYEEMWNCTLTGPHAYGHESLAGTMSDVQSSPGDPMFYMHHAFVDHNWRIWQNQDHANRVQKISGWAPDGIPQKGWEPMTLDYVLDGLGVMPSVKTRDVMDTLGGYLCYRYDY